MNRQVIASSISQFPRETRNVSERNERNENRAPLLHCIDVPTDDTLRRVRDDASTTETPRVRAKRKRVRGGERRERRNAGHDDDDDDDG
jgi:hypothetical protein